jgi:hypothetical protein
VVFGFIDLKLYEISELPSNVAFWVSGAPTTNRSSSPIQQQFRLSKSDFSFNGSVVGNGNSVLYSSSECPCITYMGLLADSLWSGIVHTDPCIWIKKARHLKYLTV